MLARSSEQWLCWRCISSEASRCELLLMREPCLSLMVVWTFSFPLQPIKTQSLLPSQLIFTPKCLIKCQTPNTAFISFALSQRLLSPANTYQYNCFFFVCVHVSLQRQKIHSSSASDYYSPRCFSTTLWQVLVSCSYVCCNNNNRL